MFPIGEIVMLQTLISQGPESKREVTRGVICKVVAGFRKVGAPRT